MLKIKNKTDDIYELELKYGEDILDEKLLTEIFNIGIYIRKNILKNSVINISEIDIEKNIKESFLNKENEHLNMLLQKKNIELMEINNSINDKIKNHSMYLENEIIELKAINKYKENLINNLNDKIINLRENIKDEYKIEELIMTNKNLLNEKNNNSINKIGRMGEEKLSEYLINTDTLKNYYKIETSKISHSCDFCVYDEINNFGVLIENKNYQYLVPREEIQKFKNDCIKNTLMNPRDNKNKMNIIGGVFLSFKSGISEKKSPLEINIENDKILVYISEYNKYPNLIEDSILYIFNLYNIIKDILDTNNFKCIKDKIKEIINKYTYLNNQLISDITNMKKLVDNFDLNLRNLNSTIIDEIKLLVIDNSKIEENNNLENYIFNEVYNYLLNKKIKIINVKMLIEEKIFKDNIKSAQNISQVLGKYKECILNNTKIIYNNLGTRRIINSKECKNYFIIE